MVKFKAIRIFQKESRMNIIKFKWLGNSSAKLSIIDCSIWTYNNYLLCRLLLFNRIRPSWRTNGSTNERTNAYASHLKPSINHLLLLLLLSYNLWMPPLTRCRVFKNKFNFQWLLFDEWLRLLYVVVVCLLLLFVDALCLFVWVYGWKAGPTKDSSSLFTWTWTNVKWWLCCKQAHHTASVVRSNFVRKFLSWMFEPSTIEWTNERTVMVVVRLYGKHIILGICFHAVILIRALQTVYYH